MANQDIANKLQLLFIQYFNIHSEDFAWNKPLDVLDSNFKVLGNLVYLEQLLKKEFGQSVPLLENISTAIHSPKDVLNLISN